MKNNLVKKTEEDKIIELMCQILQLSDDSIIVVTNAVKSQGVKTFFDNIDEIDVSDVEKERIVALKSVIDTKEQEIIKRAGGK